ncbi:MAG: XrtA/PEP-CTERM system histidine kinase PrsK [Pseudomonadota bacterium]
MAASSERDIAHVFAFTTLSIGAKMPADISFYSYSFAALAYALLTVVAFYTRNRGPLGYPILVASLMTAIWAITIAVSTILESPQIKIMQFSEILRNGAWCYVLMSFVGMRLQATDHLLAGTRWRVWFAGCVLLLTLALFIAPYLSQRLALPENLYRDTAFAIWLGMTVLGLLLLEQIYRNSNVGERWAIKHLCLGLGLLFAYDFFMYAEGLLFRQLDQSVWRARGLVVSLGAIFIAISVTRTSHDDGNQKLFLSRHVVFHSVTLLAAGIYLILMAVVGYFIQYLGGSWGSVLQVAFLAAAGLILLALLFSGQIRARTRVWLSKHFFSYKYDYRAEWLEFTQLLARRGDGIPENIVRAMANLTKSPGGFLWSREEEGQFHLACHVEVPEPEVIEMLSLPQWLETREWIIDLQEWTRSPDIYENLELPAAMANLPKAWLIVPLLFGDQLQGILVLTKSELQREINWEDRDLLKVAGRQAASHLAQYQANQALIASRQFEAFNRLSAYVVHDLKNILAQQSLIVSNADKHKENPAFFDDVISTVQNSVVRMTRLMEQMRTGVRGAKVEAVNLAELLESIIQDRGSTLPKITLATQDRSVVVTADKELLTNAFSHIIKNAQEATALDGTVSIMLIEDQGRARIDVIDNGIGMEEDFIRDRLFKPFDTTKGLAGMGVGAFESREVFRRLGGDISVSSEIGAGSTFTIFLPKLTLSCADKLAEKEIVNG